jgi:formylglycine-generating enzyme required for sulfatase activity
MRHIGQVFVTLTALLPACLAAVPALAQSYSPGDAFRDCPSCPEMVVVPAGSFLLGSPSDEEGREDDEGPQRRVTIDRPFAVGRHEVTFGEWDACLAAGGCGHRPEDLGWGRGDRPVINISWDDAHDYVAWLSRETGRHYRVPTQAEWQYAARAGTDTPYWWGNAIGRGKANCDGCGSRWDRAQSAPVGSFAANPFGLYDVHGNVWEWVGECWQDSYSGAPGDAAPEAGLSDCFPALCGGSWHDAPRFLRSAVCLWGDIESDHANAGFRVARNLD